MQEQLQALMREGEEGEGEDAAPQAVEILASLSSLGISPELRERVQAALAQLAQAASSLAATQGGAGGADALTLGRGAVGGGRAGGRASAPGEGVMSERSEAAYQRQVGCPPPHPPTPAPRIHPWPHAFLPPLNPSPQPPTR